MKIQDRTPNPISNKKIWDMAKVISDREKAAKDQTSQNVDLVSLQLDWFDWIEKILFENADVKANYKK